MEKQARETPTYSDTIFSSASGKIMAILEVSNNPTLKKLIKTEIWNLSDELKLRGLLINKEDFNEKRKK
jgi:hypothetical protein